MSLKQKLIRTISDSLHGLGQLILTEYYPGSTQTYKVTRGENYLDMPYVVLDAPQLKSNKLAGKLRIMFWWGHYISVQLFLNTHTITQSNLDSLCSGKYFILVTDNLFNNDLDTIDFTCLTEPGMKISFDQEITKVCMKIRISEMEEMETHIRTFIGDLNPLREQQD